MLGFKIFGQRRKSLTARFQVQNESSKLKKVGKLFYKGTEFFPQSLVFESLSFQSDIVNL